MKTFNDLVFEPHPNLRGGVQALMTLNNGYEISVVGGDEFFYGDGINTFEVAVFDRMGEMIMLQETDQVLGYQIKHEITDLIQKYDNEPILKVNI